LNRKKTSPRSDVIQDAIRPYAIADKLRNLRLRKSMGLVQLAAHTGLSPAMLSKLENGRLIPTLPTLIRIATVFDVGLDYFFTNERKRYTVAVARKQDRIRFPERPNEGDAAYHFESLDFAARERKLHAFLAEFHHVAEQNIRPHSHAGVEVLYVLEGALEMRIGTETHRLEEGDAIYFDCVQRHSYRRIGQPRCSAVVVTNAS
jgi:transcriptional regulator with XRE-family HTH domain